jgi:putative lipoic acid-binding regulatory protein
MKQPIIDYPCVWPYKIIGQDEQLLKIAVANSIGDKKHQMSFTNISAGGKYRTLNLEVTVQSEEERLSIFQKLKNDRSVKFVL